MDITVNHKSPFPLTLNIQICRVSKNDPTLSTVVNEEKKVIDDINQLRDLTKELSEFNQEQRRHCTINREENYLTKRLVTI